MCFILLLMKNVDTPDKKNLNEWLGYYKIRYILEVKPRMILIILTYLGTKERIFNLCFSRYRIK